MATPNIGILTNSGKNLIDQVNAGQTKITFSKIVFSSMNNNQLTDDQIKALTTVAPQEIVVNNPEVTLDNNTGETRIRATGNNETLTDGVYVKTYAVFAKDDSGNDILYGITVSPNPNYLPEYDGVTPQAVTYSYKVNISNTSNITFTNSNDVYVSDTDLTEALQPYAKTVDVNQQLDKKVNVADMRKPASDVAGIDEVSTLQTQVDNSSVGTNLITGTQDWQGEWGNLSLWLADEEKYEGFAVRRCSVSWVGLGKSYDANPNTTYTFSFYAKASEASNIMEIFTLPTEDYSNPVISTPVFANQAVTTEWQRYSVTFTTKSGGVIFPSVCSNKDGITIYVAGYKLEKGSVATDWCPNPDDKVNVADMRKPASDVAGIDEVNTKQDKIGYTPADDSKVVHSTDMRKPASDVAGIEEVNAKQDKIGYTPADDSKVAHLSGANNFDTTPTVNNNPLLLASSLPSDLARTGQSQTFTQPQTFSIAPTITDASTSKGDNQAATMADLKSVEKSAWRVLKEDKVVASGTCPPIKVQKVLYQIDSNSNRLNLSVSFQLSKEGGVDDKSLVTLDFSEVIKNITGFKDGMSNGMGIGPDGMDAKYSGPKVIMNMNQQTGCWPDNTFWLSYDQLAGN